MTGIKKRIKMKSIAQFLKNILVNERRLLIILFSIALILRLLFVATLNPHRYYFSDTRHYDGAAMSILKGQGLGADYYREPLYPYVMAAIYFVFGHSFSAMRIFQALLGAFLVLLIYDITRKIFNRKIAVIAAILTALYPYLIVFAGILYTEMVFTTLVAIAIWFLVHAEPKNFYWYAILSGTFIGLAALCRPAIFFFVPFLTIWMLLWLTGKPGKRIIFTTLVFLTFGLILMPTLVKNYHTYHRVVLVRPLPHTILPQFTDDNFKRTQLESVIKETNKYFLENPLGSEQDNLARMISGYLKHPIGAIKYFISELPHFWAAFPDRLDTQKKSYRAKLYARDRRMAQENPLISARVKLGAEIFMLPVYLLAIVGAVASIFKSKKALLLMLLILSFSIGYCFIYAEVRYRIPVDPYMLIFTALGIVGTVKFVAGWVSKRAVKKMTAQRGFLESNSLTYPD